MIRYHFDLYPRDDPKDGARLVRFTKLQSAEYRGEANGTGAGRFTIRADTTDAGFIDPLGLQYVRVVREDTVAETEAVVGGFWLENGDFTALDEQGTRLLTFGGAGTLAYLQRAIMWSHVYFGNYPGIYSADDPVDGTYYTSDGVPQNVGYVLWRWVVQSTLYRVGTTPYTHRHYDGVQYTDIHDDDRLENPLPDLTLGFTEDQDSDGNFWSLPFGEEKAQVGDSLLQSVKRLMESGIYVSMDPDTFELNAWEAPTHRRDRTGVAWGPSVIRFQAPIGGDISTGNIKSDAKRGIAAFIRRSAILAGAQNIYGTATGSSDIPWEGFAPSDSEHVDALENLAGIQLGARADAADTIRLRMRLGTDTASGYYRPFEDILLDDLVTVHTGTGQWDLDEATFPVSALTVVLRQGGDWDAFVDLGSPYSSMLERQFQTKGGGSNVLLCPIGTAGTEGTPDDVAAAWHFDTGNGTNVQYDDTGTYPVTGKWNAAGYAYSTTLTTSIGNATGQSPRVPATAGTSYTISGRIRNRDLVRNPNGIYLTICFHSAGGSLLSVHTVFATGVSEWVWVEGSDSFTAPTNTVTMGWGVHSGSGTVPSDSAAGTLSDADSIVITVDGTGSAGTTGSGTHPLLTGTSSRAARCDHSEHFLSDRAPTVDDDTQFPVNTLWVNTETGEAWISNDNTDGAAVWVQIAGGTTTTAHSHHAEETAYDNDSSGLAATNVQDAIDELAASGGGGGGGSGGEFQMLMVQDGVSPLEAVTYDQGGTNWLYSDQLYGGGAAADHTHDHGALTGLGDLDHPAYLAGETGKEYRVVAGVLRPTGSGGWELVPTNHEDINVDSVTIDGASDFIMVNFASAAMSVVSTIATADEILVDNGYTIGAASSLTELQIGIYSGGTKQDPTTVQVANSNIWFFSIQRMA